MTASPAAQQRACLLDRLCWDQRLICTPVENVRQATTGAAVESTNHLSPNDSKGIGRIQIRLSAFDSAADLTGRSFSFGEHSVGNNGRIRAYLVVWRTLPGYLVQKLVARFIKPNHC